MFIIKVIVWPPAPKPMLMLLTQPGQTVFVTNVNVNFSGCPSFATGQKIQAEYANILVYILACTTLITICFD